VASASATSQRERQAEGQQQIFLRTDVDSKLTSATGATT